MGYRSDDAEALAGDICAAHIYQMIADLVSTTQHYASCDACPLTESQIEQLTRASMHACDGIHDRIASAIDTRRFLKALGNAS